MYPTILALKQWPISVPATSSVRSHFGRAAASSPGPDVHPHNAVAQRLAGVLVPHDGRLSLVGDAHGLDHHVAQLADGFLCSKAHATKQKVFLQLSCSRTTHSCTATMCPATPACPAAPLHACLHHLSASPAALNHSACKCCNTCCELLRLQRCFSTCSGLHGADPPRPYLQRLGHALLHR